MTLEITVEETENGFRFKDPLIEIQVVEDGSSYKMLWTNEDGTTTRPWPDATTPKEAYRKFRNQISDYWSHNLGLFFEMHNKERIDKLFEPLAKYE